MFEALEFKFKVNSSANEIVSAFFEREMAGYIPLCQNWGEESIWTVDMQMVLGCEANETMTMLAELMDVLRDTLTGAADCN